MSVDRDPYMFSEEEMSGLKQSISTFDESISPEVVNLTQEEFRRIYRMGSPALPFVEETLRCAKEYPGFSQAFTDVEKFEKDFVFSRQTQELADDLAPVLEKLIETSTTAGADAFAAARSYFESVKAAAKANKPGADAIIARLKRVYYRKNPTTGEKQQSTDPTPNPEA